MKTISIHSSRGPWLKPEARKALLAASLMLFASGLFALQAALVKTGLQQLAPLELVFFRGLICAALIVAFARIGGQSLATQYPGSQLGLGVLGFACLGLYFISIGMLPLVTATALNYTAPLFLALLVGMKQARSTRAALWLWVSGGFVGTCLLLQPSLAGGSSFGVAIGVGSGVAGAAGYLLLSRLGQRGESERVTAFYFSLVICALAAVPTAFAGFSIATMEQVGIVLAIGLLATVGQLAMVRAYAIGSPVVPATFSYSTVIFSSLLGALWWGESLGLVETAGIALIVASGILVSAGQARLKKHAPAASADAAPVCDKEKARVTERIEKQRKRYYLKNNLLSLRAAFMLGRDPQRTDYVFILGDCQDNIAESERHLGEVSDPFKDPELERMWQTRFRAPSYDVDALARMPADTLGGAYGRHMKENDLRPDYFPEAEPRHRMHFLRLRVRQTHDIWHVITGFGTDEFGEVGIQGFYLSQFPNGQAAIICGVALLKSVLRGRFGELERHVDAFCEGYSAGKRAQSLLAVKWEDLWGESVDSLRRRYGVELAHLRGSATVQPLRAAA